MTKQPTRRIDPEQAQDMLDDGATILEIAHHFRVSPQSVYAAIKAGRIARQLEEKAS